MGADGEGGAFRLSRTARRGIALTCGALALAHFLYAGLPIDAILLSLLTGGVVFSFYDVSRIGFGGLEATVTPEKLADAERRVGRAPVPAKIAESSPAPVDQRLEAALAAPDSSAYLLYQYHVVNPASSRGRVAGVELDLSAPPGTGHTTLYVRSDRLLT